MLVLKHLLRDYTDFGKIYCVSTVVIHVYFILELTIKRKRYSVHVRFNLTEGNI